MGGHSNIRLRVRHCGKYDGAEWQEINRITIQTADFRPAGILKNPHLQSVLASTPPRTSRVRSQAAGFRAATRDVVVDCGDGVRLLGHLTRPPGESNGRMVVMLHGWEGSAESTYMLSVAPTLIARGYEIFRLNLRDHGDSHHLNEDLFHSCRLDEVVGAFGWLQREYSDQRLSVVGFSLGGNFALRVAAAAQAAELSLERVVAICPVLNPAQTMIALDGGLPIYKRYFLRRWRNSLVKKQRAFPVRYDFGELSRFSNLTDMTDYFVEHYTEFPDLYTYLHGYALTGERLAPMSVPATMLLADDDPVIPVDGLTDMHIPPALRVIRSRYGGHCGFLENLTLNSWLDRFLLGELEPSEPAGV